MIDLNNLRRLYQAGPDRWPQADELARTLGLKRDDVLSGEDLAQDLNEEEVEFEEWDEAPRNPENSPAFSHLATQRLLSRRDREEGMLVAITGEVVGLGKRNRYFVARREVSLKGRYEEALRGALGELRAEGLGDRLADRLEAWIAEGRAPSLGAEIEQFAEEQVRVAAWRWAYDGVLAALEASPPLLWRLLEVPAICQERPIQLWIYDHLRESLASVRQRHGQRGRLAPHLESGDLLLDLLSPRDPGLRRTLGYLRRALVFLDANPREPGERHEGEWEALEDLDPAFLADERRALRFLRAEADISGWPTREVRALRWLLPARVARRAAELGGEEPGCADVAAILSAAAAFARFDPARALALARQIEPGRPELTAERQRELLAAFREILADGE